MRGVQRMVEEERNCAEILDQISAICRALHSVGNEILRNHLRVLARETSRRDVKDVESLYDELVDLVRHNTC